MDSIDALLARCHGPAPGQCRTKYPLVLLHGIGFRDDLPFLALWGRIPDFLARAGGHVFLGEANAWASHADNAGRLKPRIEQILRDTGAGKVNLIAHSKGGLEARFLISRLGMAGAVASLTTVCTPHRGTSVADLAAALLPDPSGLAYKAIDFFSSWMGDQSPKSGLAIQELTRPFLEDFNREIRDAPGVYYQSIGSVVNGPIEDPFYALSYHVVRRHEGENDGMVATTSCPWGQFRGLVHGKDRRRGLSHMDMVDFRKTPISGIEVPLIYVALAEDLKQLGF